MRKEAYGKAALFGPKMKKRLKTREPGTPSLTVFHPANLPASYWKGGLT